MSIAIEGLSYFKKKRRPNSVASQELKNSRFVIFLRVSTGLFFFLNLIKNFNFLFRNATLRE